MEDTQKFKNPFRWLLAVIIRFILMFVVWLLMGLWRGWVSVLYGGILLLLFWGGTSSITTNTTLLDYVLMAVIALFFTGMLVGLLDLYITFDAKCFISTLVSDSDESPPENSEDSIPFWNVMYLSSVCTNFTFMLGLIFVVASQRSMVEFPIWQYLIVVGGYISFAVYFYIATLENHGYTEINHKDWYKVLLALFPKLVRREREENDIISVEIPESLVKLSDPLESSDPVPLKDLLAKQP